VPLDEVSEATDSSCKTVLTEAVKREVHKYQPTSPIKRQMAKVGARVMGDEAEAVWLHAERGTHGRLTIKRGSKRN
jgi:hypothetical protein